MEDLKVLESVLMYFNASYKALQSDSRYIYIYIKWNMFQISFPLCVTVYDIKISKVQSFNIDQKSYDN